LRLSDTVSRGAAHPEEDHFFFAEAVDLFAGDDAFHVSLEEVCGFFFGEFGITLEVASFTELLGNHFFLLVLVEDLADFFHSMYALSTPFVRLNYP